MRSLALASLLGLVAFPAPAEALLVSLVDDEVVDGVLFHNDDIVSIDPAPGSGELWLDGSVIFPDEAIVNQNLDALTFLPNGHLLLSTASSGLVGELAVKDGDLVEFDPETGIATMFLAEGAQGQPVDVDALHFLPNGHLLLSFQKEEVLQGQPVHDGDVIEWDMQSKTFSIFLSEEIFDVDSDVNGLALLPNGNVALTTSEDTSIGGLPVRTDQVAEYDRERATARILLDLEPRLGRGDVDAIALRQPACGDGFDNDGDGFVDARDTGCAGPADDSERDLAMPCDDGIDNDGDGRIDHSPDPALGDPGCVVPAARSESPECQDGIDNQGDGTIDFDGGRSALGTGSPGLREADPGCAGLPWLESEEACGLGYELGLLLLPLGWLRRSRTTARAPLPRR